MSGVSEIIAYFIPLIYALVHIVIGIAAAAIAVFCFRRLKRSTLSAPLKWSCRILLVGSVAVVEAWSIYVVTTGAAVFDYYCCDGRINKDSSIVDVRRVFGVSYEESDATVEQIEKRGIRLRDDLTGPGRYAKKYSHRIVKFLFAYVIYDDKDMVAGKVFDD